MQYNKQFTNQGLDLFSKALSEKQSIVIDQVLVDNLPINNLPSLDTIQPNDLASHLTYQANYTSTDGSTLTVDSVMSNDDFNSDYQVNEIGLMGYIANDQSTESLIAIMTATDAFVLPRQLQGDSPIKFVPTVKINYVNSNQSNVNVQVSDGAYVAKQDLDAIFSQKLGNLNAASPDDLRKVQEGLNGKANQSDLEQSINDLNNRINGIHTSSGGTTIIPSQSQPAQSTPSSSNQSSQPTNQFDSDGITISGKKVYVQDNRLMYDGDRVLTASDVFKAPKSPDLSLRLTQRSNIAYTINPNQDKDSEAVNNYTLYYKADGDDHYQEKNLTKDDTQGEIHADNQTTYDLKATAHSIGGTSPTSSIKKIEGAHEPDNTDVSLTNAGSSGLNYSFSFEPNGSPIQSYTIYWKQDSDSNWQSQQTNNTSGLLTADNNGLGADGNSVNQGNTYDFMVTATNNIGTSSNSSVQKCGYYDPNGLGAEFAMMVENNGYINLYKQMYETPVIFPNVAQVRAYYVSIPSNVSPTYDNVTRTSGQGFYRKIGIFPINSITNYASGVSVYGDSGWPLVSSQGQQTYGMAEGLDSNGNYAGIRTKIIAGS